MAVELDLPFGGQVHAGQNVKGRGFAGAVGADETDQFAGVNFDIEIGYRPKAAEDHRHISYFE